jgi:hypothetical protein
MIELANGLSRRRSLFHMHREPVWPGQVLTPTALLNPARNLSRPQRDRWDAGPARFHRRHGYRIEPGI